MNVVFRPVLITFLKKSTEFLVFVLPICCLNLEFNQSLLTFSLEWELS